MIGTDVTYLFVTYLGRFLYLANVRDMATGEYLGWHVSAANDQDLADIAIVNMVRNHQSALTPQTILHSDRGGTYTASHFQLDILKKNQLVPSMSRKGNCLDNAPTESGHGHLKDWLELDDCRTLEDVRQEVDRVLHYFNNERPQWTRKR